MPCTVSEASGLADSEATTANPLPTHTHNEAQPPFPSGMAATAAVTIRIWQATGQRVPVPRVISKTGSFHEAKMGA